MSDNFLNEKAENIVLGMGFPSTENGKYMNALRKEVLKKVEGGVTYISPGTWKDPTIFRDHEERAREILQLWWNLKHRLAYRRELIDNPPLTFMKKRMIDSKIYTSIVEFHPESILPWIRDQFRKLIFYFRKSYIWLFDVKNPYAKKKDS